MSVGRVVGRGAAVLGVVLLVLAGATLVFDAQIRSAVESRVGSELAAAVPFTEQPEVTITGYPLVWHALQRRVEAVHVRASGMPVTAGSVTVTLTDVDLQLTDGWLRAQEMGAATVSGSVRVPYDELGRLADAEVRFEPPDRLAVTRTVDVLGRPVSATLSASAALDPEAGRIALGDPRAEVAGLGLPDAAVRGVIRALAEPIAVPLPYGLRLDQVAPGPDGVAVRVVGTDVVVPRS